MESFSKIINNHDCLFRYRTFDDGEKNLTAINQNRLYFSIPKYFNDPYDSLIFANTKKIWGEISGNILYGMPNYIKKNRENMPEAAALMTAIWNTPKAKDISMRRQFELVLTGLDIIRLAIRKNTRIICLSEAYNSMLMWSHYANNHKGFVLAYDKQDIREAIKYAKNDCEIKHKIQLEKVQYTDEQIDMTEYVKNYIRHNDSLIGDGLESAKIPAPLLRRVISQKAKLWSYEKEWRVIPHIPRVEKESELHYLVCNPKAIILGCKSKEDDVLRIKKICKDRRIPLFRMYISEFSPLFKLDINDNEVSNP